MSIISYNCTGQQLVVIVICTHPNIHTTQKHNAGGSDYVSLQRVALTFPPGPSATVPLNITILMDTLAEDYEDFTVFLSLPPNTSKVVLGATSKADIVITNVAGMSFTTCYDFIRSGSL